jgi:hypothetical protein
MSMNHTARTAWIADTGMTALLLMLAVTIFVAPFVAAPFGDAGRALLELFFVQCSCRAPGPSPIIAGLRRFWRS